MSHAATPLPPAVVRALAGRPTIGADEHAAVLLTVREDGVPHVTLLSRAELEATGHTVCIALAGRTTPANLDRQGDAVLVVVVDDTAYSCHLRVVARHEGHGMTGYVTHLVDVRPDSLGIPLRPIGFTVPPELPSVERWDASARLLAEIGDGARDD